MTVRDGATSFIDHCRVAKGLSVHTLRAYQADLDDFGRFAGGQTQVSKVERAAIRSFARFLLDSRKLKETTVKRRIATVKVFFRWLEAEELVRTSPFHRLGFCIRIPRQLPRALDRVEIQSLLSHTRSGKGHRIPRYDAVLIDFILVTFIVTGLRVGELTATRIGDLRLEDGSLLVRGKGNRERRVYLSGERAKSALDIYLGVRRGRSTPGDALLTTIQGQPVTDQGIRRRLRIIAERAGVERRVTPHMLRHTAATQLLDAGVDIRFVQRLLGHRSIVTTQIYAEVHDASLKAVVLKADTLSRIASH